MNNVMRYSLSAVFTSIATSYFVGVGISRVVQPAPAIPVSFVPSVPVLGTSLAKPVGVRDDLFRPLPAVANTSDAMWRSLKDDQEGLKSRINVQMQTLLKVEEDWKGSSRRVDQLEIKLAESQRLLQETKNTLDAAAIRIGKMEGALKVAQDRELKATMTAKRMVKMFITMSPEKAAKILEELPSGDTADLLARMKEAEAAAILTLFPPKRAAALSARLAGNRGGTP
jgi:flagellar motility protein MotE (MotC chaperone)